MYCWCPFNDACSAGSAMVCDRSAGAVGQVGGRSGVGARSVCIAARWSGLGSQVTGKVKGLCTVLSGNKAMASMSVVGCVGGCVSSPSCLSTDMVVACGHGFTV